MFNLKSILSMLVVAATIFLVSCQNEQNPIEPIQFSNQTQLSKVTIPYGATIDSAWFFINVSTAQSEEVTLHRITNYWEEMMVTWDNFTGGALIQISKALSLQLQLAGILWTLHRL